MEVIASVETSDCVQLLNIQRHIQEDHSLQVSALVRFFVHNQAYNSRCTHLSKRVFSEWRSILKRELGHSRTSTVNYL